MGFKVCLQTKQPVKEGILGHVVCTHEFYSWNPNSLHLFLDTLLEYLEEPLFLSDGSVGNKALLVLNPKGKKMIMHVGDFNSSRLEGNGLWRINFSKIRLNIEVNLKLLSQNFPTWAGSLCIARDSAPVTPLILQWFFLSKLLGVERILQSTSPVTFSKNHLAHARLVV